MTAEQPPRPPLLLSLLSEKRLVSLIQQTSQSDAKIRQELTQPDGKPPVECEKAFAITAEEAQPGEKPELLEAAHNEQKGEANADTNNHQSPDMIFHLNKGQIHMERFNQEEKPYAEE